MDANNSTHEYLVRLRDVILMEREFAKNLDMEQMTLAMQEKEDLIQILAHVQKIDEADKPLAAQIRHENRRNAYLFRATLGWVREIMEFFGKRTVTSTYSANGYSVASQINGRLLSGKI